MIKLITANDVINLTSYPYETIREVMGRYRVPLSSVFIGVQDDKMIKPLNGQERIKEIKGQVIAIANRNIHLDEIALSRTTVYADDDFATTYAGPDRSTNSPFDQALAEISPSRVISLAVNSIRDVFKTKLNDSDYRKCIVGFSGGGDSNLLLTALMKSRLFVVEDIIPVMVLGIRDWDKQLGIAQELSKKLGKELIVVEASQSAIVAGVDDVSLALKRFSEIFPKTSKEFFGTWLLRKVLSFYAIKNNAKCVMLGGNREDALSESLYLLSKGKRPLAFPVRRIGGVDFINPLYKLPKKVIDGAYSSYSLNNYENRDPNTDYGRSIFYYLSYVIQDAVPGIDATLLDGLEKLSSGSEITWDKTLDDFIYESTPEDLKLRWSKVIRGK